MPRSSIRNIASLALSLAIALSVSACGDADRATAQQARPAAVVAKAPAPPPVPEPDPGTATMERAAPPTLQAVATGKFMPSNPAAEAATGALDIEDTKISGVNGASFVTERVALVSGDDQYSAGARYADAMMIEPRQQVELRQVIEETGPTRTPEGAACGAAHTGYLALAKVMEGDKEKVKLLAMSGDNLPAPSATNVKVCVAAEYVSK